MYLMKIMAFILRKTYASLYKLGIQFQECNYSLSGLMLGLTIRSDSNGNALSFCLCLSKWDFGESRKLRYYVPDTCSVFYLH